MTEDDQIDFDEMKTPGFYAVKNWQRQYKYRIHLTEDYSIYTRFDLSWYRKLMFRCLGWKVETLNEGE